MLIDAETIQQVLVSMAWLTPIVIALVAVVRSTMSVSDRYVPLTSVIVGVGAGLLFVGLSAMGAAVGVIIGLSASGLYDFGKKTVLDN